MLILELQFPSGRYHATPWGRNVNEGEVEWPPSPYRLARALVDVWKRRKPDWPETRILPVLQSLSSPAMFKLPPAAAAHTRSFLSSNEKDPQKKQLIFDAFVVIDRRDRIFMGFSCELGDEARHDLNTLLGELNYFGRSESWVSAKVSKKVNGVEWNCSPLSNNPSDLRGETVRVPCVLPSDEYEKSPLRSESLNWLEALCLTTKALLSEGWSSPPAMVSVDYMRSGDALRPMTARKDTYFQTQFHCAKYALHSKVLPRVQETLPFAERIRSYLMGIHKRVQNDDPTRVSSAFSGKRFDGIPLKGHKHAFFLPMDEDGDGRLDHVIVFAAVSFDSSELTALDRLQAVYQSDGRPDVNLILVSLSAETPGEKSKQWVSATPFVTSRHYRKGRGAYEDWLAGEIARECDFHDLPEPKKIQWIPHTMTTHHPVRWMEFIRSRKNMPQLRGYGCILDFDEPVAGPFVLGSGCHFGLGLFMPYHEK